MNVYKTVQAHKESGMWLNRELSHFIILTCTVQHAQENYTVNIHLSDLRLSVLSLFIIN